LTNVFDPAQLSLPTAGRFYRWRWGNEVYQPEYASSARLYQLAA